MIGQKKQTEQMELILDEIRKDTKNRIKELSFSCEKLGKVLKRSPLIEWKLDETEIENILGKVSMEVCADCGKYYDCYKKRQASLLEEVSFMLFLMERKGRLQKEEIPESFGKNCIKEEQFLEGMLKSYELICVHRIWRNKMLYHRKTMALQMEEMSRILFGCSAMLNFDRTKEGKAERMIRRGLKKEKIQAGPIRFYENGSRKKEVVMTASVRNGHYPTEKVARIISRCLSKNMIPSENCPLSVYRKTTLIRFEEEPDYYLLCGNAAMPRYGNSVCGDIFSVMKLKEGKQVCILADGMGTGKGAREESSYMVELMEQLLESGFKEEETVRLTNTMLSFGEEKACFASFDFLSFQLYTGMMKIIKSGSAATFLLKKGGVEMIECKTPPAGLLTDVEFDVLYKKLYDGDKIVMISDGVTDHLKDIDPEDKLGRMLPQLCQGTPKQAAERILKWILEINPAAPADDMSVLVIYIWKKKHTY